MSKKQGQTLVTLFSLVVAGGVVVLMMFLWGGGGGVQGAQEELGEVPLEFIDVGQFKIGASLGQERAGFSGRAMVQIFTSAADTNWAAISACLRSQEVSAEMAFFTGILIDPQAEPSVESIGAREDDVRVIVRRLNGELLGGLSSGFTCPEFLDLLRYIRGSRDLDLERSPIYALLMEYPEAIDFMIEHEENAKAARYVELLKEFEGANSPATLAAQDRLNR